MFDQPVGGKKHQRTGAFITSPTFGIESSAQSKAGMRRIARMHETVLLPDGTNMSLVGSGAKVPSKLDVVPDLQLATQEGQDLGRYIIGRFGERSHETDAAQKRCISKAVVCASEVTDYAQCTLVKNKVLGEGAPSKRPNRLRWMSDR